VQLFSVRAFIQLEYCPIPSVVHTGDMTMYILPTALANWYRWYIKIGYTRACPFFLPFHPSSLLSQKTLPSPSLRTADPASPSLQNDERGVYKKLFFTIIHRYLCNRVNTEDEGGNRRRIGVHRAIDG
jgi:hypothetical protein